MQTVKCQERASVHTSSEVTKDLARTPIWSRKSSPVPQLHRNRTAETMQTVHALLVVYTRKAEGNGLISM